MRKRLISILTAVLLRRRVSVLTLTVGVAIASLVYSGRTLYLDADTDSLIGEHQPFMADYRAFKRTFGDLEYLIVAVDAQPPGAHERRHAEAKVAVAALVEQLRALPDLRAVHGFISADEQMRLAPWSASMTEEALDGLTKASAAFRPLLERRPAAELLAAAQQHLDDLLPGVPTPRSPTDTPPVPASANGEPGRATAPDRARQERDGAAAIFLLRAIAAGAEGGDPAFPLASLPSPRFLSMPDPPHELGRFLFVTILPQKDYGTLSVIERPLAEIRGAIARVQPQVPDVEIGLTGKPVLQADEMTTTNDDMTRAALVGTLLVALLFMAVFRSVRRPLLAVLVFAVGAALTYGAAALLVGRLNLLSLVFMLVLVGVGLDYGIHMMARYTEGLRHLSKRGAIRHMMRKAVPSNATGAIIAGGTFLIALLTPFQGLRELGVIAGAGLLICMIAMALLIPILLDLFDSGRIGAPAFVMGRERRAGDAGGEGGPAARHWAIAIIGLALAITAAVVGPMVIRFESNLLELQADSVDAVKWEKRIIEANASETWFGAVIVDRIDAIPPVLERAAREPAIGAVRSVLDLVAMPTPSRSALLATLGEATQVSGNTIGVAAPAGAARDEPTTAVLEPEPLRRAAGSLERLALLASVAAPSESATMRSLASRLRQLADELDPVKHDGAMIAARRQGVDDAVHAVARWLAQMGLGARGTLRDALPAAVRDEFTSESGAFCVRLHPARDVWEFEPMEEFVAAMRRVAPNVTGVPITQFESMLLLERSFLIQGIVAALFVAVALFVDLRSMRETIACLLALGAGLAWTLGLMALLGVSFNLANFFGVPIALGLGSDACIHIAHRARHGLAAGFGSTRRAVTITALTTVIGFGGLLFAQHRGLQSLGVLMVVSTLAMLLSTTMLLPTLLRLDARLRSSS